MPAKAPAPASLSVQQSLPGTAGDFKLPSDGWFHLAPFGEFAHKSGFVQVIDKASVDAMVRRFRSEMPDGYPGLLLDYEHESHTETGSTAAAGWIIGLEGRADGLWGKIRWSDEGKQAVAGGRYRFVSPTWLQQDCESLGNQRLRPMRLNDVALTNRPNLGGMTPLSHKESGSPAGPVGSAAEQQAAQQQAAVAAVRKANPALTFTQAWEAAKRAKPELFQPVAKMEAEKAPMPNQADVQFSGDSPVDPVGSAAAQRVAVAAVRKANPALTFSQAWEAAKLAKPELFQAVEETDGDLSLLPNRAASPASTEAKQREVIATVRKLYRHASATQAFEHARQVFPELFP